MSKRAACLMKDREQRACIKKEKPVAKVTPQRRRDLVGKQNYPLILIKIDVWNLDTS